MNNAMHPDTAEYFKIWYKQAAQVLGGLPGHNDPSDAEHVRGTLCAALVATGTFTTTMAWYVTILAVCIGLEPKDTMIVLLQSLKVAQIKTRDKVAAPPDCQGAV